MEGSGWLEMLGIELELKDFELKIFGSHHDQEGLKFQYKNWEKTRHDEIDVHRGELMKTHLIRFPA